MTVLHPETRNFLELIHEGKSCPYIWIWQLSGFQCMGLIYAWFFTEEVHCTWHLTTPWSTGIHWVSVCRVCCSL